MSDDELASSIARSVEHRVGALSPRPDIFTSPLVSEIFASP